jgi:catechol 2,3-dioxygenase-like lactoylglutathione lyase family enzyme
MEDKLQIQIRGLAPLLQVFDMPVSILFYRDILGFELVDAAPKTEDDHFDWALLRLDGYEIMLNTAYEAQDRPVQPDAARMAAHHDTAIYFGCPDIEGTYQLILSRGWRIAPPHITGYGFRSIELKDPDGYILVFHWPQEK